MERHLATSGYGRWLGPLGRWDGWDLGGRFEGRRLGERRKPAIRCSGIVSSGPSTGRTMLASVTGVLAGALGSEPPHEVVVEVVVEADADIEMVSRLSEDARAGLARAFPGAILVPPGAVADRLRWLRAWPPIDPEEALARLGLPDDADWEAVVTATDRRVPEHWAAGVAYRL